MAFALFDLLAALAAGEQSAQPAISRAVARIDQDIGRAIHEDDARANQKFRLVLELRAFQLAIGAHHAGERIVVGNADRCEAVFAPHLNIFLRMRGAAQEGEIGGRADLRVKRRHANNPCMNQEGCTGWPVCGSRSRS